MPAHSEPRSIIHPLDPRLIGPEGLMARICAPFAGAIECGELRDTYRELEEAVRGRRTTPRGAATGW